MFCRHRLLRKDDNSWAFIPLGFPFTAFIISHYTMITNILQVKEYQISCGILELVVSRNVLDIKIIQFLIQIAIDLCQNDAN